MAVAILATTPQLSTGSIAAEAVNNSDATITTKSPQQRGCFKCGQLGHKAAHCKQPKKEEGRKGIKPPKPEKSGRCPNCQGFGHGSTECPSRKCSICKRFGHVPAECYFRRGGPGRRQRGIRKPDSDPQSAAGGQVKGNVDAQPKGKSAGEHVHYPGQGTRIDRKRGRDDDEDDAEPGQNKRQKPWSRSRSRQIPRTGATRSMGLVMPDLGARQRSHQSTNRSAAMTYDLVEADSSTTNKIKVEDEDEAADSSPTDRIKIKVEDEDEDDRGPGPSGSGLY